MRPLAGMAIASLLLVGCIAPEEPNKNDPNPTEPTETDSPPTVDTDTDVPTDTDTTTDTSTTDTSTTDTAVIDCTVLPAVPVNYTTIPGFSTAEDFDFDGDGFAVSIYDGNLVGKDLYGNNKVISPNVSNSTAGTRVLATGDWVINDVAEGVVQRVDVATGAKSVILSGLSYPNGLEVDEFNQVYVADQTQEIVIQVDAYTGDSQVIAEGLTNPNGVILSPDGNILYVGSFGGGTVYAIDKVAPGVWDPPRKILQTNGSDGGFDGINVDACGNVYITEYIAGDIWRITPDGQQVDRVVSLPSSWIPNMRWGSTFGGWDPDILYVADRNNGNLFALEIGVPGKKHLLAP